MLKQTPTWNEVVNDKNYANIAHDEDAVASEVHSRLSGENGAKVLEQMIKDARKDGAMAVAKAASITERIKEWIKDMFAALKETLSAWSKQDLAYLSIEDFNNLTLRDLAEGVNPDEFVTEEGDVQFMGSRVDKRMADISNYFNGRTLSAEQQAVVDVYSGKSNNLPISINRADSNIKVVMRQGVEQKAGAKHSLFRHYGTNVGVITSEDIILIPEIFANGERVKKQHGNTTLYEYKQTINGVKYTVLTEVNNRGAEIFDDYYTDRSKVARSSNTQLSARADSNLASQHKVTQNSANSNSIATTQDISFSIVDAVEEMVEDAKGANEEQLEAKENGTYLKTPNGKTSKLSPKQWVQVRTSRFKEWFGDWELAYKKNYLLNGKAVSTLTGNEFSKVEGKTLTDQVEEFFNSIGNKAISPIYGEVILDRDGADDSLAHGMGRKQLLMQPLKM